VNEIIIRAVIDNQGSNEKEPFRREEVDKDSIISECVEQVLEILKDREER